MGFKQGQQFDQTRYGDSLDTLDPVVLLLLGGGGHPVDGVLPLHHLQQRRVRVRFHTIKGVLQNLVFNPV